MYSYNAGFSGSSRKAWGGKYGYYEVTMILKPIIFILSTNWTSTKVLWFEKKLHFPRKAISFFIPDPGISSK